MQAIQEEFDAGSLSLVKREIELALARADEGIVAFSVKPDDHNALTKTTLPPLHQVSGVLRMVGMEPAGHVVGAAEKLVEILSVGDLNPSNDVINAVRDVIKALNKYLEGLLQGEPNRPLTLFPTYQTVLAMSGSGNASEIDLFYPDLTRSPAFDDSADIPAGDELAKHIARKRTEFQKGLIDLLRGTDHPKSLVAMARALAAIDGLSFAERRVLWWIAIAYLEGLAGGATSPDVFQKQLCGRIDLQIKRQFEEPRAVPEGLIRELLLGIAYMRPASKRVDEIQQTYRLANLLPRAESPEATRVKLFINEIKEQVETAKETWLSFVTGSPESLPQFLKQTVQLNDLVRGFGNESLQVLFAKLVEVTNNLTANPRLPDEVLSLETATVLLVARDALDDYPRFDPNLAQLAETVAARLTAALTGNLSADNDPGQLLDISWSARKKQLFFQIGQEVLSNLNRIEEVLDAFFREPQRRAELGNITTFINQIGGVLAMLESGDALLLLQAARKLVEKFAADTAAPAPQDAELIAEAFSNLGLFVVALQKGQDNPQEILQQVLVRFGITPTSPPIAQA